MKTNKLRRLAAAVLAGTMMMAMSTSAFAAGVTNSTDGEIQVTLTKTVDAEDNVKAPNTSFTFAIANGEATTKTENDQTVVVYAGETGGAYFAEGAQTITFTPADELTKTTKISFDVTKFPTPGVYRYEISETATTPAYDGMAYDQSTYYMDVYVVNGDNGNEIQAVTTIKDGNKADLGFTNTYTTNNLILTKKIDGNQADMTKEFDFTVTINGADGEKYTVVNGATTTEMTSGTPATFDLGDSDYVTIYGLSANDTYTIVEDDYSADGYVTTITGADETTKLTATGNVADADDSVLYTNTKNVASPTGIITNVLPYAMMVVVAVALAFVFLRKREYDR